MKIHYMNRKGDKNLDKGEYRILVGNHLSVYL